MRIAGIIAKAGFAMTAGMIISSGMASAGVAIVGDGGDSAKPVNEPTYASHRAEVERVCDGPTVKMADVATHVVITKLDGETVRISIDEAFDRIEASNNQTGPTTWVVGVCKSDVRN